MEPRLDEAKLQIALTLQQLDATQSFGLVSFSDGFTDFSGSVVPATPANVASGVQWVQQLQATGLSCMAPAGVSAVQQAILAPSTNAAVFIVSDGTPNCPSGPATITAITAANFGLIPVHTILLGQDPGAVSFMQDLAAQNDGTFVQVP